ncbi:MAG: HAD-IIB family hydrolase [Patescibacteria group bacterium]|nr:HAD-IIB family hydrolase [Patescibacteria group bacterium]
MDIDIKTKDLIIFDLDGTLNRSKNPVDNDIAVLILRLLASKKVAIISGSGYKELETFFLNALPPGSDGYNNLLLLPASGTRLLVWRGTWCEEYAEHLSPKEKERVMTALQAGLAASGYVTPQKIYGGLVEDRGSQITFSANGQNAPYEIKSVWDPDRNKRRKIADAISSLLPNFDVRIGGTNSIDITKRGVNKGYGIRKLEEYLHMSTEKMLFVGDKLMSGGNDYPVKATGVDCIQVSGPGETKKLIDGWLDRLS